MIFSGYPNEAAVHVALGTVRQRLEELKQKNKVDSVSSVNLSCVNGIVLFVKNLADNFMAPCNICLN